MKKQLILGVASLLALGTLSTGTVLAAESTVPVSYDNRNAVVDPSDPLAEWSVSIPTAVAFTKDAKVKSVDVELVPINGATIQDLKDSKVSVKVEVKSANGLKLKDSSDQTASAEALDYTVVYGSNSLTGTSTLKIADLTGSAAKVVGNATFSDTNTPTKRTMYTDQLTYTITKN